MSNRQRASLVLVYFNSGKYLPGCLQSVLPSISDQDEIILVDNGSQDGGLEGFEQRYPTIRLVRNPTNLGLGGGCNAGAELAQGEYLVFLNIDTRVEPLWLEVLLQGLETLPDAGLTTAQIRLLSQPQTINACGNDIHISGISLCRLAGQPKEICSHVEEVNSVSGAAFAIRRDLFQTIGGFDPDFFMYMEETDLCLRARLAGYRCYVLPSSVVYHDYQLRFGANKVFYQERNRYLMLLKNLRWSSLIALAPVFFIAELVTWGFVLLRQPGKWREKFAAYHWILENWPAIRQKHCRVQSFRQVRDSQILRSHAYRLDFAQTGPTWTARAAHWIFDPIFFIVGGIARCFIWW